MASALLNGKRREGQGDSLQPRIEPDNAVPSLDHNVGKEWNHEAEIKSYVGKYGLKDVSDVVFAAFVVHYYTELAPEGVRKEVVTASELQNAVRIADRKPPTTGKYASTLSNARQARYLEHDSKLRGYKMSDNGRYRLKSKILVADE